MSRLIRSTPSLSCSAVSIVFTGAFHHDPREKKNRPRASRHSKSANEKMRGVFQQLSAERLQSDRTSPTVPAADYPATFARKQEIHVYSVRSLPNVAYLCQFAGDETYPNHRNDRRANAYFQLQPGELVGSGQSVFVCMGLQY